MGWIERFRTSRGFGVHSPFAYALVTDALRPGSGYAYYVSAALPDEDTRLVYRLAAHLGAGEVKGCPQACFKGFGPAVLHVLRPNSPLPDFLTGSDISKPIRSRSEVKADDSRLHPESPLPEGLHEGDAVLIFNPTADSIAKMTALLDSFGGGMSFLAGSNPISFRTSPHPYALFCFLSRLPRQDFHLHT